MNRRVPIAAGLVVVAAVTLSVTMLLSRDRAAPTARGDVMAALALGLDRAGLMDFAGTWYSIDRLSREGDEWVARLIAADCSEAVGAFERCAPLPELDGTVRYSDAGDSLSLTSAEGLPAGTSARLQELAFPPAEASGYRFLGSPLREAGSAHLVARTLWVGDLAADKERIGCRAQLLREGEVVWQGREIELSLPTSEKMRYSGMVAMGGIPSRFARLEDARIVCEK